MKEYKVVECPDCRTIQVTQACKVMKCFRCAKSTQVGLVRVLYRTFDGNESWIVCSELKRKLKR